MGSPQSQQTLWGEDERRNECVFALERKRMICSPWGRQAGFGEGTPQQDLPKGQNRRYADFGTVVESCSKKVAAFPVWAFADTLDGEGGASANFAAVFLPLIPTTPRKAKLTEICENFFLSPFSRHNTDDFWKCQKWAQKNRKPFLISCLGVPFYVAAVILLSFPRSKLVAYA